MNNNNWKKLDKNRMFKEHEDNFVIIKPNEHKEPIPFECPVCGLIQKDSDDPDYYRDYKCCYSCAVKWAERNKKEWKNNGWRPSETEIKNEIEKRLSTPIKIKIS